MRDPAPWRARTFAAVATAVLVFMPAFARAQTPPPWTLLVRGQPLAMDDVVQVLQLEFAVSGLQPLTKARAAMPAYAPYVYFAGRAADGKPLVWASAADGGENGPSDALRAEVQREMLAAGVLGALDRGLGGVTLQRLYAAVRDDSRARTELGLALVDAVKAASDWTVAASAANRRWVFATLQAGMSRSDAYALLGTRKLDATTPASGEAYVDLPGEFQVGCSFSNRITIAFDAADRVKKLDLSPPKPNCL